MTLWNALQLQKILATIKKGDRSVTFLLSRIDRLDFILSQKTSSNNWDNAHHVESVLTSKEHGVLALISQGFEVSLQPAD